MTTRIEAADLEWLAPGLVAPALLAPGHTLDALNGFVEALLDANTRVNLVSRSTTAASVWSQHVRHCLVLARRAFPAQSVVVDWGTGGGLPGAVLAAWFGDVEFVLVDSIAKKCAALREIVAAAGLSNVRVWHGRAEAFREPVDYAVSRATAPLVDLWGWTQPRLRATGKASSDRGVDTWRKGLIALKGGDLTGELHDLHARWPAVAGGPTLRVELGNELGEEREHAPSPDGLSWSETFAGKRVVHVSY